MKNERRARLPLGAIGGGDRAVRVLRRDGRVLPGDALWLTLIVAFLAVLFVFHQLRVSRELSEHGDEPILREVQRIRERRRF